MNSVGAFNLEFNTILKRHPKEILGNEKDFVFRFDLARQIFLERGL